MKPPLNQALQTSSEFFLYGVFALAIYDNFCRQYFFMAIIDCSLLLVWKINQHFDIIAINSSSPGTIPTTKLLELLICVVSYSWSSEGMVVPQLIIMFALMCLRNKEQNQSFLRFLNIDWSALSMISSSVVRFLVFEDLSTFLTLLLLATFLYFFRIHFISENNESQINIQLIKEDDQCSIVKTASGTTVTQQKMEEEWEKLLNMLPHGVAIQCIDTQQWRYGNSALSQILSSANTESAFTTMTKLMEKISHQSLSKEPTFSEGIKATESDLNNLIGNSCYEEPLRKPRLDRNRTFDHLQFELPEDGKSGSIRVLGNNVGSTTELIIEDDKKLLEISGKTIYWENKKSFLFMVRDLTSTQKMDRLKVANLVKTRILGSLSHELRNPINCIIQSLEHCKGMKVIDEDFLTNINIALANSNLLLNKYNDVLDFLKIEMGELEMENVSMSIRNIVSEVNDLLSFQVEVKKLQFIPEVDRSVPSEIYSDPNRIRQVVLNLVENAVKYTSKGKIVLRVKKVIHKNKEALQIEVSDTGKGIAQSRLPNLFSLDEIGSGTNTNKRISVSLPIAFQICKRLGDDLKVETKEAVGSKFHFIIYTNRELSPNKETQDEKGLPKSHSRTSMHNGNTYTIPEWDVAEEDQSPVVAQKPNQTLENKSILRWAKICMTSRDKDEEEEKKVFVSEKRSPTSPLLPQQIMLSSLEFVAPPQKKIEEIRKEDKKAGEKSNTPGNKCRPRFPETNSCHCRQSAPQKRSFSSSDVNDSQCSDASALPKREFIEKKCLKESVTRIYRLHDIVAEAIAKDPTTIKGNVIRSKNQPILASVNLKDIKKKNLSVKDVPTKKVLEVKNSLLKFVKDPLRQVSTEPKQSPPSPIRYLSGNPTPVSECAEINIPKPSLFSSNIPPGIKTEVTSRRQTHRHLSTKEVFFESKQALIPTVAEVSDEAVMEKMVKEIAKRLNQAKCEHGCKDILIVDDSEFNRYLLLQQLSKFGFNCNTEVNGALALEEVKSKEVCECGGYKLILMDIDMPEMNGIDATINIRKTNSIVQIVAVSAYTANSDIDAALLAGMNDYVPKPVKMLTLMKMVVRWLGDS